MKTLLLVFWVGVAVADPLGDDVHKFIAPHFSESTPGCAVSVRHDKAIVYEQGYGAAKLGHDRAANTPDTRFRMASVTKPVLSLGLLHLREKLLAAGEKDLLVKTLGEIYPALSGKSAGKLTLRSLLEHTSGLPREPSSSNLRGLLVELAAMKDITPGKYAYSNIAYMLLADVLTRLSGEDWKEYLRKHVFRPLGMTRTLLTDPVALWSQDEAARPYEKKDGAFTEMEISPVRRLLLGSGGLFSTARDMSLLAEAIERGEILSAESWKLAFTATEASLVDDPDRGYGLGWMLAKDKVWHTGGGCGAATLFQLSRDSSCRFTVAILCNFEDGSVDFDRKEAAEKIRKIYCP